ncbi:hypothetical protein Peur_037461 [Populus x canadensis]
MAVHVQQNGFVQRLEFVQVRDCGDVRAPFPAKLLRALKNLSSVRFYGCKSLEEVFELGEPDEGSSEEKELPLLSSLTLSKLPELKCIWKGPTRHVSEVAEDSSINREWTKNNGWKKVDDDDDDGSEEEEEDGDDDDDC